MLHGQIDKAFLWQFDKVITDTNDSKYYYLII